MYIELQDFVLSKNLSVKIGSVEAEFLVSVDCELTLAAKLQKITLISIKKPAVNLPFQIIGMDEIFYAQVLKFVVDEIENDPRFEDFAKDAVRETVRETIGG